VLHQFFQLAVRGLAGFGLLALLLSLRQSAVCWIGWLACWVSMLPLGRFSVSSAAFSRLILIGFGGEAQSRGKAGAAPGVFGALGAPAAQ
jgi:hypothetical protein